MGMIVERLSLGVKDLDHCRSNTKISPVRSQLKQGFGRSIMEQAIQKFLIAIYQWIELSRDGEDHMEIFIVYHIRAALIDP